MRLNPLPPSAARANWEPDPASQLGPAITFTGERRNEHFTVLINGHVIDLRAACLSLLIDLVLARAASAKGYLRANSVDICRLRRRMDEVVGPGTGKALIETGSGAEYRLTIPIDELPTRVTVTECFFELVERKIVSQADAERLRSLGGAMKSS